MYNMLLCSSDSEKRTSGKERLTRAHVLTSANYGSGKVALGFDTDVGVSSKDARGKGHGTFLPAAAAADGAPRIVGAP